MLTKEQIKKRFDIEEDFDAEEIHRVLALGVQHGRDGVVFEDDADFDSAVGLDIEQIEALAFLTEGALRRAYDEAVAEGAKLRTPDVVSAEPKAKRAEKVAPTKIGVAEPAKAASCVAAAPAPKPARTRKSKKAQQAQLPG